MWARFIAEYDRLVYPHSDMTWKHFFIVTSWIFVCPGLCLWCSPCACCKERNFSPLQKGAAAWLEIVNADLEPRGMYARFQISSQSSAKVAQQGVGQRIERVFYRIDNAGE